MTLDQFTNYCTKFIPNVTRKQIDELWDKALAEPCLLCQKPGEEIFTYNYRIKCNFGIITSDLRRGFHTLCGECRDLEDADERIHETMTTAVKRAIASYGGKVHDAKD